MLAFEILLVGATLVLLLPVTVLFAEVVAAATSRDVTPSIEGPRMRLAILMPAHNEASIIADALRTLIPQMNESDKLIVIADNCTDNTAAIAASEGAEVIARTNSVQRGKGYALDFGVRHLERDAPDIVVIVDADCLVTADSLDRLARVCAHSGRPVQALYLMRAPEGAGPMMRIAEFAGTLKNRIRPMGLGRMGLPCHLMGTGMAFPWTTISTARLATGHIVEDLKLGIELARAGTPPQFCPDATVTSTFPISNEGIRSQRIRWEHGHLGVILSDAPSLLLEGLTKMRLSLLAMGLDLSVPPLALLMLLVTGIWLTTALWYIFSARPLPLVLATIAGALLAFSVLLSWARWGRQIVSLGTLAMAVIYALWKIPLYIKFIAARQLEWVRSKRDTDEP